MTLQCSAMITLHCHPSISSPSFPVMRCRVVSPVAQDPKKGFGAPSRPARPIKVSTPDSDKAADLKAIAVKEGPAELQKVLKSVEKDRSKKKRRHLNIDPNVAAKGKVDFVKVESWGSEGQKTELEDLRVKSVSPAFSSTNKNAPFYERLVHRLQLLESKGDISIVQAQSLPPFQEWMFGEKRYLQYLVDQHAVFDALRCAVSTIQLSTKRDADLSTENDHGPAAMAIGIFDVTLGLDRSEVLEWDIKSLSRAMGFVDDKAVVLPEPTTQTTAYVKYLKQLVRVACNDKNGRKESCLRLLAHMFAIYVAHLTTGMRIGAKALDCILVLKEAKAVGFYRDYPEHVTDPLKIFIAAVNKITDFVSVQDDQEQVMDELPKAIQKTSLLLSVLAVKEQPCHTPSNVPAP